MIIHIFLVLFAYLYGCSAVHWAVQVDGGIKVAEQIALENGFNFVGKVSYDDCPIKKDASMIFVSLNYR